MTVLIQKEVAEKIVAKKGKHTVISVQTALFGEPEIKHIVAPNSFHPEPKVTSAVLNIKVFDKNNPNFTTAQEAKETIRIVRIAFANRRKKIINGLRTLIPQTELERILDEMKLDRNIRPQSLSINEWKILKDKTIQFFSNPK